MTQQSPRRFHRGATEIVWAEGCLVVSVGADVLLVDVSQDAVASDAPLVCGPWLPRVRAVAVTSGRLGSIGGLLPLLCALEPHRAREATLTLHLPATDERAATLAEVWMRHWPDRYPIVIDSDRAGASFDVGPISVQTIPLATAEIAHGEPQLLDAVGMILRTGEASVAYLRGIAPPQRLARCCEVDLAIIEVGLRPWPRTDRPLRLRLDEAVQIGAAAGELWLLGDDGAMIEVTGSSDG